MEGLNPAGPHDVPPLIADIECDGGEVAVVSFPYPIGKAWQGKIMIYDLFATVRHPVGKGDRLRSRTGTSVSEPGTKLLKAFQTPGSQALEIVRNNGGSTTYGLTLLENVNDVESPGVTLKVEVLWVLDRPTGGFPVG